MKETPIPIPPAMVPMAVAVVLWLGGNHVADITGCALMATGPANPFNN